jgi:hypothetical protein
VIAPEPTEVEHHERWRAPWDLGIDPDRFISCLVTVSDGVGAAGHLGVIEERCPGPHAEEGVLVQGLVPCGCCGADSSTGILVPEYDFAADRAR